MPQPFLLKKIRIDRAIEGLSRQARRDSSFCSRQNATGTASSDRWSARLRNHLTPRLLHRRRRNHLLALRGAGSGDWMAAVAAPTEEPRLMESVTGAEDAVENDAAVGEAGEVRGDEDDEILRFMDSVDGYLLLMDSLSSALRQGWIDLASARHSMGPSRVSSTLLDHKEQSAKTKLQMSDHADANPSESKPLFTLLKWCLQEESASNNDGLVQAGTKQKLRHRGSATIPEDGNHERDTVPAASPTRADTINHVQRARSKALSVFGGLVSPKLRNAQISFETALELIVELANSRSSILSSFYQIKE